MTVMAHSRENIPSQNYIPHPHHSELFCPDPDLGLTPERSPSQLSHKKSVRFISPAKSKAKRKVVLPGKENAGLADIDLPAELVPQTKNFNKKSTKKHKREKFRTVRHAESSMCTDTGRKHHLDTPELHTTLHLGRDILQLQSMNIDLVEAVKHRLIVSENDRTTVKQKTFARLNERPKSPSAFGEVVSLNVPTETVVDKTERQLTKSVKPLPPRQQPAVDRPTLSKFFRPEMALHSCVSLEEHGYQPRALQIDLPSIDQAAFEHHQRLTLWELKE